ncbi:MAG: sigma-54-dependent Fis family transcriptional regulator [Gammaproteobacteria bacterium]|nr:sigma-54-dependent Fis family transcriptional regulator [Gammaproteobacteria bacterium]
MADNFRVLIIADDDTLRKRVTRIYKNAGYTPSEFPSAAQISAAGISANLIVAEADAFGKSGRDLAGALRESWHGPLLLLESTKTKEELFPVNDFCFRLPRDASRSVLLSVAEQALRQAGLRHEAERYRQNLRGLMRSVHDAVIVVDRELTVLEVNEIAHRVCGLPMSMVGKSFLSIKSECAKTIAEVARGVIQKNSPAEEMQTSCTDPEGHANHIQVSALPLLDSFGKPSEAVLIVRNKTRLAALDRPDNKRDHLHRLMGGSGRMQEIYDLIVDLADIKATVLITGESGTGKGMAAEALHYQGSRAQHPLIKVNCSALPDTLLESELFGHVKGAFTSAIKDRMGRFQLANKGTIFLDEIGDISPGMQAHLLRVLQDGEFERVGDSRTIYVDVRVVTATNRNLRKKVEDGSFREDLYYRLNVVEIHLPPLREKKEDIQLLTKHLILKFNTKYNKNISGVTEKVMETFMNYSWPGNVRELEHVIEHASATSHQAVIKFKNLPKALMSSDKDSETAALPVNELPEKQAILQALGATRWKKNKAAQQLGMSRSTLYRKMEQYSIKN